MLVNGLSFVVCCVALFLMISLGYFACCLLAGLVAVVIGLLLGVADWAYQVARFAIWGK